MLSLRKSGERGRSEHGWLDSRHTFSFAGYHDPRFAGFRSLLVINEDRVAPSGGFGRRRRPANPWRSQSRRRGTPGCRRRAERRR
jgi:redox-sensitive bicupin YhaK (pirin superfamily)